MLTVPTNNRIRRGSGLVTPVSSADPGRAARPGPPVVNDTAGAVADLGDVMAQVGTAVEKDRLDREMQRLRIDMMQGMKDLRLETEQIDDPDTAEATWKRGLEELRISFDQPGENGQPRLDPGNAEPFQAAFDDVSGGHAYSLGARTLQMRAEARRKNAVEFAELAADGYVSASDENTRNMYVFWFDQDIDARVAAGEFTPDEGERIKDDWIAEAETVAAMFQTAADDAAQFESPVPDGAEEVRRLMEKYPEARRLAIALNYVPDSEDSVYAMYEELDYISGMKPDEQHLYVNEKVKQANQRIRVAADRPRFSPVGEITPQGLQYTAQRLVSEYRAGRLSEAEYGHQARLVLYLMESFDGG